MTQNQQSIRHFLVQTFKKLEEPQLLNFVQYRESIVEDLKFLVSEGIITPRESEEIWFLIVPLLKMIKDAK